MIDGAGSGWLKQPDHNDFTGAGIMDYVTLRKNRLKRAAQDAQAILVYGIELNPLAEDAAVLQPVTTKFPELLAVQIC